MRYCGKRRFRQRPILPGRVQPSTFGTEGLNFCVRDGNRWDPFVIVTGNCELVSRLCLDLRASPLSLLSTLSELIKDVCCGGFAVAPTPLRIVPDAFASLCKGALRSPPAPLRITSNEWFVNHKVILLQGLWGFRFSRSPLLCSFRFTSRSALRGVGCSSHPDNCTAASQMVLTWLVLLNWSPVFAFASLRFPFAPLLASL